MRGNNSKMKHQVIQVRPNVSDGFWLGYILPLSIAVSIIKHNVESSLIYQHCFVVSLGILYSTIVFTIKYTKDKNIYLTSNNFIFPATIISFILFIFLDAGPLFSCYSGIVSSIGYYKIYIFILKKFALCFTFGEALFCAQGITLFFYSTTIGVHQAVYMIPKTSLQIATLIIQIGLTSIALICYLAYRYQYFRTTKKFYIMAFSILAFLLLLPLHVLLRQSPLMWMYKLFTDDITTVMLFLYWTICCFFATITVIKQIQGAQKASTAIRKTFHILAVVVFLPGLLYECSIIYLASGVTFGIFVTLELLRNLNLPPLGASLQDGFMVFSDEKDIGAVALTPIYLLVGCSLPLWLHPAPCDLTNSAGFNLLPLFSGLLSIGIGDSMASYVGTWIGKHKWSGTNKTVEGTLGCILSQLFAVYLLFNFGFINLKQYDVAKVLLGVITVALVEAKTTQVDNLVLPLLMYTILM